MSMLDSHVVAYLPAKHRTHCAKLDPFGGACTCGATRVPLVRKSDADAAIAAARQAPATPAAQPLGEVVVTKNEAGQIVAVTRQDEEGRILSVIAEATPAAQPAEPSDT